MALAPRLFWRVALIVLAVSASLTTLRAQGVFRVAFDTVTAKAGDTVTVSARYTFTPSGSHSITGYSAIINWDTSEVHLVAFVLDSTATPASDTNLSGTSHHGITAFGQSEIDLTNPVLFKIRFRVDRSLADTAFIRWDTTRSMFDPGEGVGTVIRKDGWIRTTSTAGHVAIQTSGRTFLGYSNGYSPDSIPFELPFHISSLTAAGMTHARLTFSYDPSRLSFQGARTDTSAEIDSISSIPFFDGPDSVTIDFSAKNGSLTGGDSLITASFIALVGIDTVCQTLSGVQLRPTSSGAKIGNTDYNGGAICVEWEPQQSVVKAAPSVKISVFPNPAWNEVRFEVPKGEENASFDLYDELGRKLWVGSLSAGMWDIPAAMPDGAYQIVLAAPHTFYSGTLIIKRP